MNISAITNGPIGPTRHSPVIVIRYFIAMGDVIPAPDWHALGRSKAELSLTRTCTNQTWRDSLDLYESAQYTLPMMVERAR